MKLSRRTNKTIGCGWILACFLLFLLQIVFTTMKLCGSIGWSWWAVLIPTFCVFGLPIAIIVIAVIVLAPKMLIENRKRHKRIEAEAKRYGMERKPGESDRDLKLRIIRRNMIVGDYTAKDVKQIILDTFPEVGSCQIFTRDEKVLLRVRGVSTIFSENDLRKIAKTAAKYIPHNYTITAQNAETEEGEINGK